MNAFWVAQFGIPWITIFGPATGLQIFLIVHHEGNYTQMSFSRVHTKFPN
jgi:hypothetical protein